MFYFQQLLNTALAGIDGTAIISTVTNFAFAILLIGFLIGLYQAAFRGGDLQALAGTAVKYLIVAMIVSNWATVFRGVNGSFNTVANFIGDQARGDTVGVINGNSVAGPPVVGTVKSRRNRP